MKRKALTLAEETRRQERKERFAQLVKQVGAMSDEEKAALAAKMGPVVNCDGHALSMRNTLLIALQLGNNSTIVGGFRQWIKQGRVVRKGEHGASILFPRTFGEKTEETVSDNPKSGANGERVAFLSGTVFDISQTDEIEGQVSAVPRLLDGERQGDLISSTQSEDFALASQSAVDGEAVAAAKAEHEKNGRATLAQNLTLELEAA